MTGQADTVEQVASGGPATDPAEPPDPAEPAGSVTRSGRRRGWLRWELLALCELFALCGFVFVQPVLNATGGSPEFFLFHQAGTAQILAMLALLVLGPPVLLWVVAAVTRLAGRSMRAGAQTLLVGGLVAALAIQLGKSVSPLRGLTLGVLSAVVAAAVVLVYVHARVARSVLRMAAVGPVVFALLFVFVSPVSSVMLAGDRDGPVGAAGPTGGAPPPVVIMLLDEFPLVSMLDEDGLIDAERFPHFAELAGESTWYRNATTVAGLTVHAVPSMLTGRYPRGGVAPHYIEYPENLFSLLSQTYEINANESVTRLCEPWRCTSGSAETAGGLREVLRDSGKLLTEIVSPDEPEIEPFETFREPTLQERRELAEGPDFLVGTGLGENQPVRFHDFIQGLSAPGEATTMDFLHLLTPHRPWRYLPSGNSYRSIPDLDFVESADEKDGAWARWWLQVSQQRYLQQAEYADRLLGETVRTLRENGEYDDALFVVTADHGISFSPGVQGRGMDPDFRAAAELMWVPTFVRAPGQTDGVVDDRNWEHVDLLPTIADHIGVEIPWEVDGRSALDEPRERSDKYFYVDGGTVRLTLDGPEHFAEVLARSVPRIPDLPMPELIGRPVDSLTVVEGGPAATIRNIGNFADVDLSSGEVPVLVHGTVSTDIEEQALLAVAVNGRIGAVMPVVRHGDDERWFVGLVTDDELFANGSNTVELFAISSEGTTDGTDGITMRRLRI